MSDPNLNDDELEALMAELEAQNAEIAAANTATAEAKPVAAEAPAVEDEPVAEAEAEEPVVEEAAPVEAVQAEAATDSIADEDDLASLQAELEVEQAEAESVPAASVAETLPAAAVEALTKNGTAIDEQEAYIPLEGKTITVTMPPREEPRRPTEATGPGNLQHYIDVDQFRTDTRVSEANLDQCMIEQNGLRAWYGAVAARAEAQAARVKAKFEVVEATLYDHHRKELAKSGEKTTEKMVENAVKLDPRWLKAKNMVIEAETIATINKGLVESIKDRRDMIIQLGADRRDEYKGAARVLAEQGQRDELRDRAMRAMQSSKAA